MTPLSIGLTVFAVCLSCLGIMAWLAFKAPHGWEDSEGFHAGEHHSDYDQED